MSKQLESKSKFLSLILRHKPEEIGIALDPDGWVSIDELIQLSAAKGVALTNELIQEITATSEKKRFAIDPTGQKIRANQGHSIAINLNLAPLAPPTTLFHGTATRFLTSIQANGLISGSRQHVHLSAEVATAVEVGSRHGKPVVLKIRASDMHHDGYEFYKSANGVWLTKAVPPHYLEFSEV